MKKSKDKMILRLREPAHYYFLIKRIENREFGFLKTFLAEIITFFMFSFLAFLGQIRIIIKLESLFDLIIMLFRIFSICFIGTIFAFIIIELRGTIIELYEDKILFSMKNPRKIQYNEISYIKILKGKYYNREYYAIKIYNSIKLLRIVFISKTPIYNKFITLFREKGINIK